MAKITIDKLRLYQIQWSDDPIQTQMKSLPAYGDHKKYYEWSTIDQYLKSDGAVPGLYYGFFSPKFLSKNHLSEKDWMKILEQFMASSSDVLIFDPGFYNALLFRTPIRCAEAFHTFPIRDENSISKDIFQMVRSTIKEPDRLPLKYWCSTSSFIIEGSALAEFFDFARPLINKIIELEDQYTKGINTNYQSDGRVVETYVPFIFERLMSYFVYNLDINMIHSQQIVHTPLNQVAMSETAFRFLKTMDHILTFDPELNSRHDDLYLELFIESAVAYDLPTNFTEVEQDKYHLPKISKYLMRYFENC